MRLIQVVLEFLFISTLKAYDTGAPPKSCEYMIPGHVQNFGRHSKLISGQPKESSRYVINATWSFVDSRYYVRVSIMGEKLRGFLIQGRQTVGGSALGRFKMLSDVSKYQDCTSFKVCLKYLSS